MKGRGWLFNGPILICIIVGPRTLLQVSLGQDSTKSYQLHNLCGFRLTEREFSPDIHTVHTGPPTTRVSTHHVKLGGTWKPVTAGTMSGQVHWIIALSAHEWFVPRVLSSTPPQEVMDQDMLSGCQSGRNVVEITRGREAAITTREKCPKQAAHYPYEGRVILVITPGSASVL